MSIKRLALIMVKLLLWGLASVALIVGLLALYIYNWESGPRVTYQNKGTSLGIVDFKIAKSDDYIGPQAGKLTSLPAFNPDANRLRQINLIGRDLSSLNLSGRSDDLLNAHFDTRTVWPEDLPDLFNPDEIMESGMDPGLNIRKLHERGINGKGIGLAIIDMPLRTDHQEYADRLKFYEVIQCKEPASRHWHPTAVSSIALGKNAGVAPEAELYFIGLHVPEIFFGRLPIMHYKYIARAINRLLDINLTLPQKNKIRVISISIGL
jgi:hypothetical protein